MPTASDGAGAVRNARSLSLKLVATRIREESIVTTLELNPGS